MDNIIPHTTPQDNLHIVYGLTDFREDVIRYVGTTNDAPRRLKEHLKGVGKNPAKDAWIKEYADYITMLPLDIANGYHEALKCEKFWIDLLEGQGIALFNIKDNHCKIEQPVEPKHTPGMSAFVGKQSGRMHTHNEINEILDHYLLTGELPEYVSKRTQQAYRHHPRLPERQRMLKIKTKKRKK